MCGFCTPGFVMSTVALLEKTPNPTPAQARKALDGNICRCGTYVRLLEAALAVKGGAPWLTNRWCRWTSRWLAARSPRSTCRPAAIRTRRTPGRRNDGSSARASTASTVRRRSPGARSTRTTSSGPGMLYGRILRSPHPHARITSIDLAPALAMKGVKAAVAIAKPGRQGDVRRRRGRRRRRGHRGSGARRDRARSRCEYEVLPFLASIEQAMRPEAPTVFEGGNVQGLADRGRGQHHAGFAAAAHVVEQTYNTQVQTHVSLETHGCVCEWEGEKLTAWVSTQAVHGTREGFATSLGIPQANVRVITEHMGGGFGSKFGPDVQGIACARLAKEAKAPVQLMLDRQGGAPGGGQPAVGVREGQGRRVGRRHAHGVRRGDLGHRRRRRGFRLPAAVHLHVPEPAARPQGRLHQRRPAARDARARASAGLLHHRGVDGRTRGPREDGPARVPHQEPAAAGAQRDVARVLQGRRRSQVRLGQAARRRATRRRARSSAAWAARPTGGAAAAAARRRSARSLPDGGVVVRCGTQDIGVGTRTIDRDHRRRDAGPAGARTSRSKSATATTRSAAAVRRFDDGAGGVAGDSGDGEQGAAGAGRARRAGRWRRGGG